LTYVMNALRGNTQLMYTLAGLMKNDCLVALLDGRLTTDAAGEEPKTFGVQPVFVSGIELRGRSKVLRASMKKVSHLTQMKYLLEDLLAQLDPFHFQGEKALVQWKGADLLGVVCFALGVSERASLPHVHYKDCHTVSKFFSACSQRYEKVGKPLLSKSREQILQGYYSVESNTIYCNVLPCTDSGQEVMPELIGEEGLQAPAEKRKSITYDNAENITIANVFDVGTEITIMQNKMRFVVKDTGETNKHNTSIKQINMFRFPARYNA
jgi:hypothetical protein